MRDRQRILLVINDLEWGGAEQQLLRVAAHLQRTGYEVAVLTLLSGNGHAPTLQTLGIPLMRVRMIARLRAPSSVKSARSIARQWRPDLIMSFLYQSNMVMRLAAVGSGIPVVSSIRNEYFGGRPRELAMRLTDRLAVRTVTNSVLAADSLKARRVVSPERLRVIPNGLPVDDFDVAPERRERTRRALGVAPDQMLWLGVGRLWPQKNWPVLIDAVSRLTEDIRARTQVAIAGDGSLEADLREHAASQGLGDVFRFLGRRGDIPDLLAASDALILTSDYEGLPNVVLEAMASARPVVATAVGGTPELITHGRTGFLVPPGESGAVASAILDLTSMPAEQRREMGTRGRTAVRERYSLGAVMQQWSALVYEILDDTKISPTGEETDNADLACA